MSLEELYREVILDHYRSPRNKGKIDEAAVHQHKDNPLCGDEVDLYLDITGDKITGVKFEGRGCSISQASVSMMTEKLHGIELGGAEDLAENFSKMMTGEDTDEALLGDLTVLEGVKKFPVRIKCALLGWEALSQGAKEFREQRRD